MQGHSLVQKKGGPINSRRKGLLGERVLVRYLHGQGLAAEKISRTGYTGSDVSVPLLGIERRVECKMRAKAFGQLYRWLANSDLLIVRADRKPALVVVPLWLEAEIAAAAEGHGLSGPTQRQLASLAKTTRGPSSSREEAGLG